MKLKKCHKCGNLVEVIEDCNFDNCGIICCKEVMSEVKANSVEAALEKHRPEYKVEDDMVVVEVNHVMEKEHYIEWIMVEGKNVKCKYIFNPGDDARVFVPYERGIKLYAYCNKHGLWENIVE